MIHLTKANQLKTLARKLAEDLKVTSYYADPFLEDWIVVQNRETQLWLQKEISGINGISANLKFIYPSELGWNLIRQNQPELPRELPTDRVAIQSRVFDFIVTQKAELSKLGLDVPDDSTIALNLSESIADVFDLYQVFRPELLQKWTLGIKVDSKAEQWQACIWNALNDAISESFPDIPMRFELKKHVQDSLNSEFNSFPGKLHIFGLSHWSKSFIHIIEILANKLEIQWYDQNMSNHVATNERLIEWGKPKIEVQDLFHSLNQDIINETIIDDGKLTLPPKLRIHSCHNIEREVQVLRNELLSFLDSNKKVTVDDILIMVPDFDKYAPILENEFKSAHNFPSLPIYIPETKFDSVTDFIIKLIQFYQNGEKISDFMELLNHSVVKKTFDLSEVEIGFYESAFADMNIHFGLLKKESEFSIEKGVEQLLMSYTMSHNGFEVFKGNALLDIRSTSDLRSHISKLSRFHRALVSIKNETVQKYTLLDWLKKLRNLIHAFIESQNTFYKRIDKLIAQLEYSNPITEIPFISFQNWFLNQLSNLSAFSTAIGTGITVSSFIPYRNLPFQFVAILGFNEGVFPRNIYRPDFDLIHKNPQPGDRITKSDDSLLFLERMYSTYRHLHLSYVGEGERGSMPSLLMTQLLEIKPDTLIKHHKLHGFGQNNDVTVPIYSSLETEISSILDLSKTGFKDRFEGTFKHLKEEEIELKDLILFFAHPSKQLLTSVLKLRVIIQTDELSDREPFVLTGLDRFHLKNELVEFYKGSDTLESFKKYGLSKGILPRGAAASKQFSEENSLVEVLNKEVQDYLNQEVSTSEVAIENTTNKIRGSISDIYGNERVIWKTSRVKPKDIIELWIYHLVLAINNQSFEASKLIGYNQKKTITAYRFQNIRNPIELLHQLLETYTSINPDKYHWCCIPSLAYKFVEFVDNPRKQSSELSKVWFSTDYISNEDADYYNHTLWKNELPWENKLFAEYAEKIWLPIIDHLEISEL